jgi:ASPIC and UnbV
MVRLLTGGSSYLASHDKRVVFGLGRGPAPEPLSVDIRWPNGQVQRVSGLTLNRYHRILETSASHTQPPSRELDSKNQ